MGETGKIIVFDGLDGVGKSTQAVLLEARLEEDGLDPLYIPEPAGPIRDLLLNVDFVTNDAQELLLFMAARAGSYEQLALPHLKRGKPVIYDRWRDSSTAYQGHGRSRGAREQLTLIETLNNIVTKNRVADMTYILRLPVEEAIARMNGRKGKDRMEQEKIDFFERVDEGFEKISQEAPERYHIIDATRTIEDIAEEVYTVSRTVLGLDN